MTDNYRTEDGKPWQLYQGKLLWDLAIDQGIVEIIVEHNLNKEHRQSAECLEQLAAKPSVDVEIYYHAGKQRLLEGNAEKASSWLRLAVEREPGYGAAHRLLGIICISLQNYEGALVHLRIATSLNPADASAWAHLCIVCDQLNLVEEFYHASSRSLRIARDGRKIARMAADHIAALSMI